MLSELLLLKTEIFWNPEIKNKQFRESGDTATESRWEKFMQCGQGEEEYVREPHILDEDLDQQFGCQHCREPTVVAGMPAA
jgi:hypothetical protein